MFSIVMRMLLIRKLQLALLCLLVAPLQSFAGSLPGGEGATSPLVAEHCVHHPHGHTLQHSNCDMSCCAALASEAPSHGSVPRVAGAGPVALVLLPPPTVVQDRLDRPPR